MVKKADKISLVEELIRIQLEMVDKTVEEVDEDRFWFSNNQFEEDQFENFKSYAISKIMESLKLSEYKAERFFNRFYLDYGLKIKSE